MGASFRSKEQALALAGCDFLTISPSLLKEMAGSTEHVEKKLDAEKSKLLDIPRVNSDEKGFRWGLGEDPCATAKLAEGIVKFAEDTVKLEALIKKALDQ